MRRPDTYRTARILHKLNIFFRFQIFLFRLIFFYSLWPLPVSPGCQALVNGSLSPARRIARCQHELECFTKRLAARYGLPANQGEKYDASLPVLCRQTEGGLAAQTAANNKESVAYFLPVRNRGCFKSQMQSPPSCKCFIFKHLRFLYF